MRVYKCQPDREAYSSFRLVESQSALDDSWMMWHSRKAFQYADAIDRQLKPLDVIEIATSTEGNLAGTPNDLPLGDIGSLVGYYAYFVVSRHSSEVLGDLFDASGHYLPTKCSSGDWQLFIVDDLIDALDESNARIRRWPDGRIMEVREFAFSHDCLASANMFIIKDVPDVFATETFVRKVHESGITGFHFELTPPDRSAERKAMYEKYSKRRHRHGNSSEAKDP